jgi:GAF domain-containing protein
LNAPIMMVGVKDVSAASGFRPRYKRDLSHADGDPTIEQRFIDAAIVSGKPVLHGRMPKLPTGGFLLQPEDSIGSLMAAPLLLEGRVIGYLAVRNPNDGAFDESDLVRFVSAASLAALAVQNEITADEAAARRAELQIMLETARMLAAERDLTKFFEAFHGLVRGVMDAESFFVGLGTWSNGGRILLQYCVHHHRRIEQLLDVPVKGTVSGHVFREGMPLILRSPLDFRPYATIEQGSLDQIQSGIVMPLQNGHRVIGIVAAQSSKPNAYSVRERDLLEVLAELCAIAVETSAAQQQSA